MKLIFLLLLVGSLGFVTALEISQDSVTGVTIVQPTLPIFNNETASVNHSNSTDWWVTTDLGAIDSVSDLINTYVPYTGATGDVNLGTHNLVSTGYIRVGDTATEHQFRTGTLAGFNMSKYFWLFWDFPELEPYNPLNIGIIQNGIYLRGEDITPTLSFYTSDIGDRSIIDYNIASDSLNFTEASGGYEFDNGEVIIDSDTNGLILGDDRDYKIYSTGSSTVYNADGNNIDHIFWDKDGHDLLRIYSDVSRFVQIGYNGDNAGLSVIGNSTFGYIPSTTKINVFGQINQTGLAYAQFRKILMNAGDSIYMNGDVDSRIYFGASQDAYCSYNNANLVCNPRAVGTGNLTVLGSINATEYFQNGANVGITGNYSLMESGGDACYMAFSGGIMYGSNCTTW